MRSRPLVSWVLAVLLLAAPAALTAAPVSPRPAAAVPAWDAAFASVRALLADLLLPSGHPGAPAHRPGTSGGAQADNCSNMDPNGLCSR